MSNVSTTFRSSADLSPPQNPLVYNVSVPLANTEYSQILSPNTKMFTVKCRTGAKIQLSYISGNTGTLFITIPKNTEYEKKDINFSGTLYFRSDTAGVIVEIEEWV